MIHIERSALVNWSAGQMFDLVNDIERYPQFMQGCQAARELERSEHELLGELTLGMAGMSYSFITRNTLHPPQEMRMELVQGPFRHFDAAWHFKPLTADACKVSLNMRFDFAGGILGSALEKVFNKSANSLVAALVAQADRVYGGECAKN
ncbi:MAG: type II toxin-antitoxin system RatA family toxin [Pseudomonadales bacterium]|nr:type II toxin-antitoxin system RatA family toxin [Pseudomonadales bacterium]